MTASLDFEKLIEIGDQFAEISFEYKGPPSLGMMAWLDSMEMKTWWKADNVIIEPYPGGMFYIAWSENDESNQTAIYGVMETLDADKNHIEISKIFYMSSMGKMGPFYLQIRFEDAGKGFTRLWLRQTHKHEGQLQKLYKAAVFAAWPKSCSLLIKYLENEDSIRK